MCVSVCVERGACVRGSERKGKQLKPTVKKKKEVGGKKRGKKKKSSCSNLQASGESSGLSKG